MSHPELIVFDLDDTLLDTSNVYWLARSRFLDFMEALGAERTEALSVFESIEEAHFEKMKHSPERYGLSMLATFELLLPAFGNPASDPASAKREIRGFGRMIFEHAPELLEGARALLEWARVRYDMALITRGTPSLQLWKLETAKIGGFFDIIEVVGVKTPNHLSSVISDAGHAPSTAWVIGDSLDSDIQPGLEIGARCIFYKYEHTSYEWHQRHFEEPEGEFFEISSLREAIPILESRSIDSVSGV